MLPVRGLLTRGIFLVAASVQPKLETSPGVFSGYAFRHRVLGSVVPLSATELARDYPAAFFNLNSSSS
jgi:hypothetical protein